jgi:hypothetical protein
MDLSEAPPVGRDLGQRLPTGRPLDVTERAVGVEDRELPEAPLFGRPVEDGPPTIPPPTLEPGAARLALTHPVGLPQAEEERLGTDADGGTGAHPNVNSSPHDAARGGDGTPE